jgi:hypothetical protein
MWNLAVEAIFFATFTGLSHGLMRVDRDKTTAAGAFRKLL